MRYHARYLLFVEGTKNMFVDQGSLRREGNEREKRNKMWKTTIPK